MKTKCIWKFLLAMNYITKTKDLMSHNELPIVFRLIFFSSETELSAPSETDKCGENKLRHSEKLVARNDFSK